MNPEQTSLQRIRKLTIALMISGGFNIALAGGFGYWILKERPPTPYYELQPVEKSPEQPMAMEQTSSEVIESLKALPYDQLRLKLENTQLVENGYTQRDLALAVLVGYYHFDLARALPSIPQPMQKRALIYGTEKIHAYPGLTDQQFAAIIDFANTEKWPLTSQGLFSMVRKQNFPPEPSLIDAFVLTPQYLAVELLFNRADVQIDKMEILAILKDGDWPLLSNFAEKQKISQDLSPFRRQRFLIEFVKRKSKAAAYVMLKTDGDFAAKKLDDPTVLQMLELLSTRTPSAERFSIALLSNPRSDEVWNAASARLYNYAGESAVNITDPHAILTKFVPQAKWNAAPKKATAPPPAAPPKLVAEAPKKIIANAPKKSPPKTLPLPSAAPLNKKERVYIVQDGDSYWKIAKKFKIDVNTLKSYNNVQNDFLKPGMSLKIPNN